MAEEFERPVASGDGAADDNERANAPAEDVVLGQQEAPQQRVQPEPPYPWPPTGQPAQAYQASAAPQVAPCGNYVDSPKKNRKWVYILVIVLAICLTVAFSVTMCSATVASVVSPLTSTASATASPTVAVITIDDSIEYDGSACSPEGFKMLLDEAADDPNIVALVLRVDSGGGVATAGEEMTTYLREFMETTGKPVVVSSASTNASAAYEISSQANYIFTAKSSAIGAIGTAMQLVSYEELLDMLGISVTDITSSSGKDSTYGTRSLTDDEIALYQHQVDQINETFVETVAEGRHMTTAQVEALANGMTYTGIDAIGNGLADEVGTLEDAMDKAADLAGVGSYYGYELYISSSDLSGVLGTLLGTSSNSTQNAGNLMKEYVDAKSIQ